MGGTRPWSKLLVCAYLLPSVYTQTSRGPLRSIGGGGRCGAAGPLFTCPFNWVTGSCAGSDPNSSSHVIAGVWIIKRKRREKKGNETFQNTKHTKQKTQIWFPNRLNHSFGNLSRGLCLLIPVQMGKLLPIWWTRVSSWHLYETVGWVLTVFLPYRGRAEDTVSVTSAR